MKILLLSLIASLLLPYLVVGPRIAKDISKKKAQRNAYAIVNAWNGLAIRVQDAHYEDGRRIILYPHHDWECITWQRIQLDGDTYLLKNLYTEKTFQPAGPLEAGVLLVQTDLGGSPLQHWEFLDQNDSSCLIRLRGTDLYLTSGGDTTNAPLLLQPREESKTQLWKLVRQSPFI